MKPFRMPILTVVAAVALYACGDGSSLSVDEDIAALPADSGGIQSLHPLGSDGSPLGYLLYEPSGAGSNGVEYPLLVFLHGSGELDDTSDPDSALVTCARGVVSGMLKWDRWNPPIPMIVASPHSGAVGWDREGNPEKLREFIQYLSRTYSVNPRRIYLTGYSLGGYGTYNYLATFGDTSLVAAAVPIAGGGWAPNGKKIKVPVWAFHGDQDAAVGWEGDVTMIDSINAGNPAVTSKITIFPGVSHNDVVIPVYDGTAMGTESSQYAAFQESIFSWLSRYTSP